MKNTIQIQHVSSDTVFQNFHQLFRITFVIEFGCMSKRRKSGLTLERTACAPNLCKKQNKFRLRTVRRFSTLNKSPSKVFDLVNVFFMFETDYLAFSSNIWGIIYLLFSHASSICLHSNEDKDTAYKQQQNGYWSMFIVFSIQTGSTNWLLNINTSNLESAVLILDSLEKNQVGKRCKVQDIKMNHACSLQ